MTKLSSWEYLGRIPNKPAPGVFGTSVIGERDTWIDLAPESEAATKRLSISQHQRCSGLSRAWPHWLPGCFTMFHWECLMLWNGCILLHLQDVADCCSPKVSFRQHPKQHPKQCWVISPLQCYSPGEQRWSARNSDGLPGRNSRERDSFLNPPRICKLYANYIVMWRNQSIHKIREVFIMFSVAAIPTSSSEAVVMAVVEHHLWRASARSKRSSYAIRDEHHLMS